jgi:ATP-dependent helicase HrpB
MQAFTLPHLPIHPILPRLKDGLRKNQAAVLVAEPGSGKTTIVPLALLDQPWLKRKKIIMLEPRRLAARMAAARLSDLAGQALGELVGYRIRFDTQVGPNSRIEVVTEGIFSRMIQNDPDLPGIGLVIFDEFHLRSIQSDLSLALCLDMMELRTDLKILLMSATMDSGRVSGLLGDAPVISGEGSCFPVVIHYLEQHSTDSPVWRAVRAINQSLKQDNGDILVFLPGAGEIKAVQRQITGDNILCLPLYGNLPRHKQDMIFAKTPKRRVILATPIAETSLTIEGITVVIDCGLMKTPHFSPSTGLTTLRTVGISKASADQRTGRAGRLAPGICYRLWPEHEHYSRPDFLAPEVLGADLAPLILELLRWGVTDPGELKWLDPPRQGAVQQARQLLAQLDIINDKGAITPLGREVARLPLHPRLALMLIRGKKLGLGPMACRLAALLQNRDILYDSGRDQSVDIEDRLQVLMQYEEGGRSRNKIQRADSQLCGRILKEARQYQRILKIRNKNSEGQPWDFSEPGNLLASAYPDRIAMRKVGSRQHLLASGHGVTLPQGDHLQRAEFLVAAALDSGKKQGRIYLAATLSGEDIRKSHSHLLKKEERIQWKHSRVEAVTVLRLGELEIDQSPIKNVDPERITDCLLEGIAHNGLECLNWHKKSRELQARIETAHSIMPEKWVDVSDQSLLHDLSWLRPYLGNSKSLKQLKKLDIYSILLAMLSWQEQQELDRLLPTHYLAASGSHIKLNYAQGEAPVLAVRLQEMFGTTDTPSVYNGKIPILIHLLSPARRPVQVTADLNSFWKNTYGAVKKELAGRYPKHHWPDDPMQAQATARCKPRK